MPLQGVGTGLGFFRNDSTADANPLAVAAVVVVGVTAAPLRPFPILECESAMDDGEIAEDANYHVVRLHLTHRSRPQHHFQELGLVSQRAVGLGASEILGQ